MHAFSFQIFRAVLGLAILQAVSTKALALTLVENGKPAAVLVLPDDRKFIPYYAAMEFQHHVKKASGAVLPIASETDAAAMPGGKVYFGKTRALDVAGLGTKDLGKLGYAGRLKDGALFFYGEDTDLPVPDDVSAGEFLLAKGGALSWKKSIGTQLAVLDFLDAELGARWIWPGPTGEYVPEQRTIAVENYDRQGAVRYKSNHLLQAEEGLPDQRQWLMRQKFLRIDPVVTTHSYTNYWRDYKDTHPEIFSLLPNGRREPIPGQGDNGHYMTMCVSSPKLLELKIERWKNRLDVPHDGNIDAGYINVFENDITGRCTCAGCRAWDAPDPRFATHEYWAKGVIRPMLEGGRFFRSAGPSLTDRYMKFALKVQAEADKIKPGVEVRDHIGYQQDDPPKQTKLNERVLMTYVGAPGQFWDDKRDKDFRERWNGWRAAGPSMFFRGNTLHRGHNYPDIFARRIGEAMKFCVNNGLVGTEWDAWIGQWAVQGPNAYMIGRMLQHPEKSTDEILEEYYSAFGPAKKPVGAYFDYWDTLIAGLTSENEQDFLEDVKLGQIPSGQSPAVLLSYAMTPEVMAHGRGLIEQAKTAAAGQPEFEERVRILDLGLRNAELTLDVVRAYRDVKRTDPASQQKFLAAADALEAFRKENDGKFLNYGQSYINPQENAIWGGALKEIRARAAARQSSTST